MIDRIFLAALTFCLLAAGTLAVVSALLDSPAARVAQARVVHLPAVEISLQRSKAPVAVARSEPAEPASRSQQ